jgi:hypothetical protein
MNFLHNDLGNLSGEEVVEVTLDTAANVKLMDSANFGSYQRGGQHRYYGGLAKRSPLQLPVPHAGHWHVAIDLGGYAGAVRAGVVLT